MIIADGGGGSVATAEPKITTPTTTPSTPRDVGAYEVKGSEGVYHGPGRIITTSPATTPSYPPGPTCPPGERLYKVSGTSGTVYVYASDIASRDEITKLAGQAGFVTAVMSPEAYLGGAYPNSREVTTVDGQKVIVPYEPKSEAVSEYVDLYGPIPSTSASEEQKAAYKEAVSGIQSQIEAGAYVSPLSIPIPEVQRIAEASNLTYQQALMEAKTIAGQAIRNYSTKGTCGPLGMTLNEATISSAYLSAIGRQPEADIIKSYYVSLGSTLENQLKKAEDVNLYGVFANLKPYRTGESYDLPTACASGVCNERSLSLMGFSPDVISGVMSAASALKSLWSAPKDLYDPETGQANLAGLIGSGSLTESQASLLFSKEDVETALATMGPSLGPSVFDINQQLFGPETDTGSKEIKTWSISQEGGGFRLKLNYTGDTSITKTFGSYDEARDYVIEAKAREVTFVEKVKSFLWGATPWKSEFPEPTWEVLGTPEFSLMVAGITSGIPSILSTILAPAGKLANILTAPIKIAGHPLVSTVLTKVVGAAGSLMVPTVATTGAALVPGLGYKPESAAVSTERILSGITTEQRKSILSDYLKQAAAEYDKVIAGGQTPTVSREEFLEQAEAEFSPRLGEAVLGQVSESMAYQPGLTGWLGRSGEVLSIPLRGIESLKVPGIVKGLASGFYQVAAPLTVATALWPEKGWKSFATMIPYYGPITVAGAMTWKEQPWYGELATVGFTVLPAVSGVASYYWTKAAPSPYRPFPKEIISYGPKGEVYVNLGKGYGWRPYSQALEVLKVDVSLAKMYQPSSIFGTAPGFWPEAPRPIVLRPQELGHVARGGIGAPPLAPSGPSTVYKLFPEVSLTKTPYLPYGGVTEYPFQYYPDTFKGLTTPGTAELVGTRVYGEMGGKGVFFEPIQTIGLRNILGMPGLMASPKSFSLGVIGKTGWATIPVSKPPVSLEPFTLWRTGGGGGGGGGGLGPSVPPGWFGPGGGGGGRQVLVEAPPAYSPYLSAAIPIAPGLQIGAAPPAGVQIGHFTPPAMLPTPTLESLGLKGPTVPTFELGGLGPSLLAAGVPFMITNQMRQSLRGMDYSDEDIDKMTPEKAHKVLGDRIAVSEIVESTAPSVGKEPALSLKKWAVNELARLRSEFVKLEGMQGNPSRLDIILMPNYEGLSIAKGKYGPEMYVGTKYLELSDLSSKEFLEGISHELSHFLYAELEKPEDLSRLVELELKTDRLAFGRIRPSALVNLTKYLVEKYKISIAKAWGIVSKVVSEKFIVPNQILAEAEIKLEVAVTPTAREKTVSTMVATKIGLEAVPIAAVSTGTAVKTAVQEIAGTKIGLAERIAPSTAPVASLAPWAVAARVATMGATIPEPITIPLPQPEPFLDLYKPTPFTHTPYPDTFIPEPFGPESTTPKPKIVPPLFGGAPGLSIPITGGMKGLLRGSQWIIPGAILHMPEPFGKVGKRKISLWKEKRPRYGARAPRLVTGGLRI